MQYVDYVNLGYRPAKSDLICSFYFEPGPASIKEAAGAIAAESSIGTWTATTTTKPYMLRLAAKVFDLSKKGRAAIAKIAYPIELFESGNLPNILSSIAGNIFGMKEVKNLRLLDVRFPEAIVRAFKGPKYGIQGIRKFFGFKDRPLIGTIIKPKLGLKTVDHARVAYQAWAGGCDIVKDDENLASQTFNRFENRLKRTMAMKRKAERETGEKKVYMINITAETKEMLKRAKLVQDYGNEYAMVDIITTGWAALQTLRNENFNLILHGHRAGHAALDRNPKHGIKMAVIAKLARLVGLDQLHVGTVVGKMAETEVEVRENVKVLKESFFGLKPVMPVASGGLHPGHVLKIYKIFGKDVIIQMGGGIHGHPKGTMAGARAARQAIDAVIQGLSLNEFAKTHTELKEALNHFKP
jgi:ribulose-bisphosphate carboxylase large chain